MSSIEQYTEPRHDMGAFDDRDEATLRYLGLNPNSPADRAAVAVCRAYGFDAVLKHVVVIPKGGVYITRDGLLHVAHRSGQLDGIVVEQEPILTNGEWVARVSVYRKDMRHPFTYPGRYSATGGNRQYAPEMALKAAEAHALRRAFEITGLPTLDEQRTEEAPRYTEPASAGDRMAAMLGTDPSPAPDAPTSEPPEAGPATTAPVEASAGEDSPTMFDYRSGWARAEFFPALRAAEEAAPGFDAKAFMSDVVGRPVASSKELLAVEAQLVFDNLPRGEITDAELVEDAES
jgi:hypothetical protein